MAEIPYRFDPDTRVEKLIADYADLDPATETDDVVTIAGRLMLRRVQGKLAFGTLDDGSGRIQLFAPFYNVGEMSLWPVRATLSICWHQVPQTRQWPL